MEHEEDADRYERMRLRYSQSPIHKFFGLELGELGPGLAVVNFSSRPEFLNVYGDLHGGVIATVLDSTLLQTVRTLLGEEDGIVTLEVKVNYVAPARGDRFTCRGDAIHAGGSVGVAEARLKDGGDRTIAVCLGTLHLKRRS
jgi:acyl-CoA thioesterase